GAGMMTSPPYATTRDSRRRSAETVRGKCLAPSEVSDTSSRGVHRVYEVIVQLRRKPIDSYSAQAGSVSQPTTARRIPSSCGRCRPNVYGSTPDASLVECAGTQSTGCAYGDNASGVRGQRSRRPLDWEKRSSCGPHGGI